MIELLSRLKRVRPSGDGWMARCPAHDDREPSLSIAIGKDGKVLLHCHAGCDQDRVIDILRSRGLWEPRHRHSEWGRSYKSHQPANMGQERDDTKRTETALRIWQACALAPGSLVENYLQSRGLGYPLSPTIRFHAGLKHPTGGVWPAMVALVTRGVDNSPLAIHRTYLARDGSGKAPVEPQKMMLGPCRGGAVRLGVPSDVLMVGEGIETCVTAMQATGRSVWAALSTSGLSSLDLPTNIQDVTIIADGDAAGEAAAIKAARNWSRDGRRVRIARPPWGLDFNDVLMGGTSCLGEVRP